MLLQGDCLIQLKSLADNSVDSIVTDPPYGLSFMGKKWDYDVPTTEIWLECLRVLKPGGHLLAFFGTRTYHRGVVRIEDAGFEIRDQIMWIYGSGFPKSHNVKEGDFIGWGTALKPANEPIVVARKPLEKGLTIAENVMKWGTSALNIDASRIDCLGDKTNERASKNGKSSGVTPFKHGDPGGEFANHTQGRWPANVLFDEEAAAVLDGQSGMKCGAQAPVKKKHTPESTNIENYKKHSSVGDDGASFKGDSGGASRFFYVAKASKRERNAGLEGMPKGAAPASARSKPAEGRQTALGEARENFHPTVKPIKLMEYLITLVTPPNGSVLDPFMGSGSTGVAAKNLNRKFIGIELDETYFTIAQRRLS